MVSAACATAAAILGYEVLRRSRSARLMLSVLAVPLFLAGLVGVAGRGFFPAIVTGAIVMLWFQPARGGARDWMDGKAPRPAPTPPPLPVLPPPPMSAPPPSTPTQSLGTPPGRPDRAR